MSKQAIVLIHTYVAVKKIKKSSDGVITSLKATFNFATGLPRASISSSVSAYRGDNMGSEEGALPLRANE